MDKIVWIPIEFANPLKIIIPEGTRIRVQRMDEDKSRFPSDKSISKLEVRSGDQLLCLDCEFPADNCHCGNPHKQPRLFEPQGEAEEPKGPVQKMDENKTPADPSKFTPKTV